MIRSDRSRRIAARTRAARGQAGVRDSGVDGRATAARIVHSACGTSMRDRDRDTRRDVAFRVASGWLPDDSIRSQPTHRGAHACGARASRRSRQRGGRARDRCAPPFIRRAALR
ncbi:hypothetical protein BUC_4965 [Burkholderia pseudomallei 576]|nr:hypothetical protein BUC_4965 [Burkholderia pseudomallei 576]